LGYFGFMLIHKHSTTSKIAGQCTRTIILPCMFIAGIDLLTFLLWF